MDQFRKNVIGMGSGLSQGYSATGYNGSQVMSGASASSSRPYYHRVEEEQTRNAWTKPTSGTTLDGRAAHSFLPLNPTARTSTNNMLRERKSERPYSTYTALPAASLGTGHSTQYTSQTQLGAAPSPKTFYSTSAQNADRAPRVSQRYNLDGNLVSDNNCNSLVMDQKAGSTPHAYAQTTLAQAATGSYAQPLNPAQQTATFRYERKSEQTGVYPTTSQAQWFQHRVSQELIEESSPFAANGQQTGYSPAAQTGQTSGNGGRRVSLVQNAGFAAQSDAQRLATGHSRTYTQPADHSPVPQHSAPNGYSSSAYKPSSAVYAGGQEAKTFSASLNRYERPETNALVGLDSEPRRVERKSQINDKSYEFAPPASAMLRQEQTPQPSAPATNSTQNYSAAPRPATEPQRSYSAAKPGYAAEPSQQSSDPLSVPASLKSKNPAPKQPNARAKPGRSAFKDPNARRGARKNLAFDAGETAVVFDPYIQPKVAQVISQAPRGGGAFTPIDAGNAKQLPASQPGRLISSRKFDGEEGRGGKFISRSVDPSATRQSITQGGFRPGQPGAGGRHERVSDRPSYGGSA